MDAKAGARETVAAQHDRLVALSHRIHAHPELGWEEEKSSTWIAEAMADAGFDVRRGAFDLPTAVIAQAGSGPLHIAFCAEYDSLPAIGHACGQNVTRAIGARPA